MKPMTQDLPVKLNDKEMRERARELGTKIAEHAELEIEKKHAADGFKSKIEDVETRIASLGRIAKSGEEYRPVEVALHKDFERSIVETIRLDTNVIVDSRPMTIGEKQAGLFDKKEKADDAPRVTFTVSAKDDETFAARVKRLADKAEALAKSEKKDRKAAKAGAKAGANPEA